MISLLFALLPAVLPTVTALVLAWIPAVLAVASALFPAVCGIAACGFSVGTAFFPLTHGIMTTVGTVAWGVLIAVVSIAFFGFFAPNTIVGYIIYVMHLKRTKKTKWTRACSSHTPVHMEMYDTGVRWSEENIGKKQDVHIVSEGLNLYGEFYDFGSDKTAILVGGRTEGLRYCYYFARPYAESGYNILTIDNRAHGESEGKYNTVGFEEHKDLLNWAKYVHENHHSDAIVFHGICIGSAGSLYAMTCGRCPDYIKGIVADGMYPNFWESFRNHMIELKKPMFGLPFIDAWMKILTGHSMKTGPIDVIDKLNKPILMLHGREDLYSRPEEAEKLYEKCGSEAKKIVWFDHGTHSLLRYTDPEKYDTAIKSFLAETVQETVSVA